MVLLSKADLLTLEDRSQVIGYVKDHIKEELNLDLAVRAVSVMAGSKDLRDLSSLLKRASLLYSQRQELKLRSIRRKLGGASPICGDGFAHSLAPQGSALPKKVEQLRVVEDGIASGQWAS